MPLRHDVSGLDGGLELRLRGCQAQHQPQLYPFHSSVTTLGALPQAQQHDLPNHHEREPSCLAPVQPTVEIKLMTNVVTFTWTKRTASHMHQDPTRSPLQQNVKVTAFNFDFDKEKEATQQTYNSLQTTSSMRRSERNPPETLFSPIRTKHLGRPW